MAARRTAANSTLLEVLAYGEGEERPFRCEVHDDSNASASVNVVKGVWYCYACGASGKTGDKKPPSAKLLLSLAEPESSARVYPESYLDLFDFEAGNFARRFSRQTRQTMRLGCDPFTGDATFPVRNERGQLCGVGRRKEYVETDDDGKAIGPRYVYPYDWTASRVLFMGPQALYTDTVVLVEGAADASALVEAGLPGAGCFGAGLHFPQQEYLRRITPKLIVLGFDADDAGRRAVEKTTPLVSDLAPIVSIDWNEWGGKDPAAVPVEARAEAMARARKDVKLDG